MTVCGRRCVQMIPLVVGPSILPETGSNIAENGEPEVAFSLGDGGGDAVSAALPCLAVVPMPAVLPFLAPVPAPDVGDVPPKEVATGSEGSMIAWPDDGAGADRVDVVADFPDGLMAPPLWTKGPEGGEGERLPEREMASPPGGGGDASATLLPVGPMAVPMVVPVILPRPVGTDPARVERPEGRGVRGGAPWLARSVISPGGATMTDGGAKIDWAAKTDGAAKTEGGEAAQGPDDRRTEGREGAQTPRPLAGKRDEAGRESLAVTRSDGAMQRPDLPLPRGGFSVPSRGTVMPAPVEAVESPATQRRAQQVVSPDVRAVAAGVSGDRVSVPTEGTPVETPAPAVPRDDARTLGAFPSAPVPAAPDPRGSVPDAPVPPERRLLPDAEATAAQPKDRPDPSGKTGRGLVGGAPPQPEGDGLPAALPAHAPVAVAAAGGHVDHRPEPRHAPLPPTVPAALVQQAVVQAAAAVQAGAGVDGPVTVTLSPEDLGTLRFEMQGRGEAIHVSLVVEKPETLELLRRHADQLATEFRQAGFAGASFSFSGTGAGGQERGAARSARYDLTEVERDTAIEKPRRLARGGLDLRL